MMKPVSKFKFKHKHIVKISEYRDYNLKENFKKFYLYTKSYNEYFFKNVLFFLNTFDSKFMRFKSSYLT